MQTDVSTHKMSAGQYGNSVINFMMTVAVLPARCAASGSPDGLFGLYMTFFDRYGGYCAL